MEDDHVWLIVSCMHCVLRFVMKEKLSLRLIGLLDILRRIGEVAYKLNFPPSLSIVHPI